MLNQIEGVVPAMDAIRRINPAAQLVQTEDAGRLSSTPALAYQAEFENRRRWLTFDLLAGRVDAHHPLRGWLVHEGAPPARLDWIADHPTPADVIGLNYYDGTWLRAWCDAVAGRTFMRAPESWSRGA